MKILYKNNITITRNNINYEECAEIFAKGRMIGFISEAVIMYAKLGGFKIELISLDADGTTCTTYNYEKHELKKVFEEMEFMFIVEFETEVDKHYSYKEDVDYLIIMDLNTYRCTACSDIECEFNKRKTIRVN